MGVPWPHALLPVVLATLLTLGSSSVSGSGLCNIGDCINCFYCDGDCFSQCRCFEGLNTCCCRAPPGYFSRGYEKLQCPAGTYQDVMGGEKCKNCPGDEVTVKYDMNVRGAIDRIDCEFAKCSYTCQGDQACEAQNCLFSDNGVPKPYTITLVKDMMKSRPARTDFCDKVGIPESGCSWNPIENFARGGRNDIRLLFGPVLGLVTLVWTLHEATE